MAKKNRKLAAKTKARLFDEYYSGESIKVLAKRYRISSYRVKKLILEEGRGFRGSYDLSVMEVVNVFRRKTNCNAVAQEFKVPVGYVSEIIREFYNVDRVKKSILYKDPEFLEIFINAYKEGQSIPEISASFSIASMKVVSLLKEHGQIISGIVDPRAKHFAKLLQQGLTLEEVGNKFDITRERVRQVCNNHMEDEEYRAIQSEGVIHRGRRKAEPVLELARKGKFASDIAEELGVSIGKVHADIKLYLDEDEYNVWKQNNHDYMVQKNKETRGLSGKHKQILALIREDKTYAEIAEIVGYSYAGIAALSKRLVPQEERDKINARKVESGHFGPKKLRHFDDKTKQSIIEDVKSGMLYKDIQEKHKIGEASLVKLAIDNIPSKERQTITRQKQIKSTEGKKEEIALRYKEGDSISGLSKKYNLSQTTIYKYVQRILGEDVFNKIRQERRTMKKESDDITILGEVRSAIEIIDGKKYQAAIQKVTEDGAEKVLFSSYIDNECVLGTQKPIDSQVMANMINQAISMGIMPSLE